MCLFLHQDSRQRHVSCWWDVHRLQSGVCLVKGSFLGRYLSIYHIGI